MAFAKFQENQFSIDAEIAENHAILVNLTTSINTSSRFISFSTGIAFIRQNPTSTDVRF